MAIVNVLTHRRSRADEVVLTPHRILKLGSRGLQRRTLLRSWRTLPGNSQRLGRQTIGVVKRRDDFIGVLILAAFHQTGLRAITTVASPRP